MKQIPLALILLLVGCGATRQVEIATWERRGNKVVVRKYKGTIPKKEAGEKCTDDTFKNRNGICIRAYKGIKHEWKIDKSKGMIKR